MNDQRACEWEEIALIFYSNQIQMELNTFSYLYEKTTNNVMTVSEIYNVVYTSQWSSTANAYKTTQYHPPTWLPREKTGRRYKYQGILLEKYSPVSDRMNISGFLSCCCRLARRTVFQLAEIVLSTFFSASGVWRVVFTLCSVLPPGVQYMNY